MKVLAYTHTFNDADVIEQMIQSFLRQTRTVDEILVVDNASTDNTLQQPCLKHATVLRLPQNTGTSGAICEGFRYALEQSYDWMWIFDPDGDPAPDALGKMLDLHAGWPPSQQDQTAFLSCLHPEQWRDGALRVYTWQGLLPIKPDPEARYYPCEVAWWSGTLYRMAAVRKVGFPNPDYFADWGEGEYGYRVKKAGFKGYVCRDATMDSNIRGYASLRPTEITRDGTTSTVLEHPPFRCYYTARNRLYLTLYDFAEFRPVMLLRMVVTLGTMMTKIMLQPGRHGVQMRAFGRGIWHGLTGNIAARY
jgi:rhamnopyranosyl-N-acetylglucosaminyl-diphospho-decaprenol beta-1,3/1,4-galactofuranosyltransferase